MPAAGRPADEVERLAELEHYGILDTEPEEDFDALTRRAAAIARTPLAAVSLVDRDRQWFKARVGLDVCETPRDVAFCAHAVLATDDIVEIADATLDPRVRDNPLVTGEPGIRFYAGVPLRTVTGRVLGTLCVADLVPRRLDDRQRAELKALAREVLAQLDARRRLRELARPISGPRAAAGGVEPAEPGPGLKIGRYMLLYKLGEGASSVVFAAYDQQLDRKVALKLIRGRSDPRFRQRVQREAQLLARVSHPNVVQIYEVGTFGDQGYLAMELIDGVSLAIWQHERERSLSELLNMYVQAGRGLEAAHRARVIHRDFKPDNVLVGADGRARIADFGLARVLHTNDEVAATADGSEESMVAGTPAYMSPEHYDGHAVDERADQFSLCAALYEAIYNTRPFAGKTVEEVRTRVSLGVIARPRFLGVASPELHAVLLRGLAAEPSERWGSLGALLDRLEALDPDRDPTSVGHERRVFVAASIAVLVGFIGLQEYRQAADNGFLTAGQLVRNAVALFAAGLLGALAVRGTLMRNKFHRNMIVVLLLELGVSFLAHAITSIAGLAPPMMLLVALLGGGFCLITAAWFLTPLLYLAGTISVAASAAIAGGAPQVTTALLGSVLSYLAFMYAWTHASAPRFARRTSKSRGGPSPGDEEDEWLGMSTTFQPR